MKHVEEKFGAEISYSEFIPFADAERDLKQFAAAGFDLVWGHGGQYDDAAARAAEEFPDTYFMTTGCRTSAPNLRAYDPKWHEMTYLGGLLAGLMTKTGKIGVVNGGEFPVIKMLTNGFILGVEAANPQAEVIVSYVGSFIEPVKGKDFATSQINAGSDIIASWAGFSSTGIFEAAREREGIYVVSEHQDYFEMGKDVSIATYVFNFIPLLEETVQSILENNFQGGTFTPGIKEGVLDLRINTELVPSDIAETVMKARQDIIDGVLVVPEIWD